LSARYLLIKWRETNLNIALGPNVEPKKK
jgi:hypothetical protein